MKPKPHAETLLQAFIIVACLLIIYFTYFVGSTGARSCTAIPPLYTDRDPVTFSWSPSKQVSFYIDDQWNNEADRQAFASGIKKWNDWNAYNCSGVTFNVVAARHFTDYTELAPDSTVYWQKTDPQNGYNGAVRFNFGGSPPRIISVNEWILPTVSNTNSYFNYLGTHEMGHTFGLTDCLCSNQCTCSPGQSIMSGQSNDPAKDSAGPSACDNINIKTIYCPPLIHPRHRLRKTPSLLAARLILAMTLRTASSAPTTAVHVCRRGERRSLSTWRAMASP